MAELKYSTLEEIKNIKIYGRTSGRLNPLALFWTGSCIELNVKGSELWIDVDTDYILFEQWMSIEINGSFVSRLMIPKGRNKLCIFRNMNPDSIKNVKIYKDVQAMAQENETRFLIYGFESDGEYMMVADKKMKIEFIGDSITSGEGTYGAKKEEDWISMFFSCLKAYPVMTAKKFDADYRIISSSGWGAYCGWDNDVTHCLPKYYEGICGILNGEMNKKLGANDKNDFSSWQPDYIVINLGTNDNNAFNMPPFVDENGQSHVQRRNDDGTFNKEDLWKFEDAVTYLLNVVRRNNKGSKIIYAYGMLGDEMMNAIKETVDTFKRETNDKDVFILPLTNTTDETVGSRQHPGLLSHQIAARQISEFINILKLNK